VLEAKNVQVREDLTVEVQPVDIEDRQVKELKGKDISLVIIFEVENFVVGEIVSPIFQLNK